MTVHLVGGHTRGLQVVRVKTRRGSVVLASDASHYYANLEGDRPFPIVVDVQEMLEGFALVRSLASTSGHVIPGHDPLVLERYPSSLPNLPHIARLDAPPAG